MVVSTWKLGLIALISVLTSMGTTWAVGEREEADELGNRPMRDDALSEAQEQDLSEDLVFLVDGMRAARARIATTHAHVESTTMFEIPGEPPVEIITTTAFAGRGGLFKYRTSLKSLINGRPPPRPKPGQKGPVPIGQMLYERAANGEIVVEYNLKTHEAVIRSLEKSPAATLQDQAQQEPLHFGVSIRGLSLDDIVKGGSWFKGGDSEKRTVRWVGTRKYKQREVHVVEVVDRWIRHDGKSKMRLYGIFIEPTRGFTIPFVSVESETNGVRQLWETIETECSDYGDGLWGPKRTVQTWYFVTPKGKGKSVITIDVRDMRFNKAIGEDDLKIMLFDGAIVDCQITGFNNVCRQENAASLLHKVEESLQAKGFKTPVPIAKVIKQSDVSL